VLALGVANGVFTVGGVGSMMALTAAGDRGQAGLRLGIFGAAQGASPTGSAASPAPRRATSRAGLLGSPAAGYAAVFVVEAVLFVGAAWLAARSAPAASRARHARGRARRRARRGAALMASLALPVLAAPGRRRRHRAAARRAAVARPVHRLRRVAVVARAPLRQRRASSSTRATRSWSGRCTGASATPARGDERSSARTSRCTARACAPRAPVRSGPGSRRGSPSACWSAGWWTR
jgi:hypothetical protein